MYRKVFGAVFAALVVAGWSGIASAALCKDVTIKVENRFAHGGRNVQIQVVDFDYWDNAKGKWREENFGQLVIKPMWIRTIATRNLEHVGGLKDVVIRVQFKYMTERNGWSEKLNAQSSPFTCNKSGPNTQTVKVLPM